MPLVESSSYRPPLPFRSAHLNTIYPALLRTVREVDYQRERLDTPDDDFIDLDFSRVGVRRTVLVLHGLEGSAQRPYVRGMIRRFNRAGYDGVGFNFRSCSGEMNRQINSYNMAATDDLDLAVRYLNAQHGYEEIVLVGFSLGGSVILNYLSDGKFSVPPAVKRAVCFSVPVDITTANSYINRFENWAYRDRFMKSLMVKMREKARQYPELEPLIAGNRRPRKFWDFDGAFTAPLHGYASAEDYWARASALPHLPRLKTPTLLVQAQDDTFLSPECYPIELAREHSYLHLEITRWGGHCGFVTASEDGTYWTEERAVQFVEAG